MERAQQLATLRQELREAFPSSIPSIRSDGGLHADFSGLPTGLASLDRLLAGQGFPRGRISELTGAISAGKTSLSLKLAATCTQQGMPVAWIDASQAFYPPSARQQGVILERLLLLRPTDLPGALKAADILLRGQAFPLVIFDWSTDPADGTAPLDVGAAIARLNGLCALSETVLLFLTSPRTAREPLRYYATVRLELQRESLPFSLSRITPANQPNPAPAAATHAAPSHKSIPLMATHFSIHGNASAVPTPPAGVAGVAALKSRGPALPPPPPSGGATSRSTSALTDASTLPPRPQAPSLSSEPPRETTPVGGSLALVPAPSNTTSGLPTRPRLVGISQQPLSTGIIVSLVKNKLGAPGSRCEVRLDGTETHRMPLHPGLPDTSPSPR